MPPREERWVAVDCGSDQLTPCAYNAPRRINEATIAAPREPFVIDAGRQHLDIQA